MTNIKDLFKKRKNPDEDKEYTDKLRNHKINKVKKYVLILLAVLVVFIGIKVYMANKTFSEYEITENISYDIAMMALRVFMEVRWFGIRHLK